jgi:hypothetical protein
MGFHGVVRGLPTQIPTQNNRYAKLDCARMLLHLTPGPGMSWSRVGFILERHFLQINSPISHPDETTHTHGCLELLGSLGNTSRALDVKSDYLFARNASRIVPLI